MDLRPIDLGDDAVLASVYAVESESTVQDRPGWVPLGEAARILTWRADDGWRRSLVGAYDGDRLAGFAAVMTAHDTPATSWLSVAVVPRARRRGVGTLLVRAAERSCPEGTTRLVASTYRRTSRELEDLVERFARPLGYESATTETVVELDLDEAGLPPAPTVDGYRVTTYVEGVPDPLRAQVGVLKGLVDAEAPSGTLHWEPTPVSPEDYQAEVRLWQDQGRTPIESLALDGTGDVVAWTCLVTGPDPARPAQVEGTLVLPPHRGHGLGAAVKVASLLAARDLGGTRRVRTSSDDANVWMRAINERLGFAPVESEVVLQKERPGPAD